MWKAFQFPWGTFSVQTTECYGLKDAVTGKMLEMAAGAREWALGNKDNHINRRLAAFTFKHPVYGDEEGTEHRVVRKCFFTVYLLSYQKDNRQRGKGAYEYKVLNITSHYE